MSVSTSEIVLGHWVHCYIPAQSASAEIADTAAHRHTNRAGWGRSPRKILGVNEVARRSHFKEYGH